MSLVTMANAIWVGVKADSIPIATLGPIPDTVISFEDSLFLLSKIHIVLGHLPEH